MNSAWRVESLTLEATPSAIQFYKRPYKISHPPDYKCPGLICLTLPLRQKFGLILIIFFLIKVKKNHLNKKCAPNLLLFNEKKIQRDLDDF